MKRRWILGDYGGLLPRSLDPIFVTSETKEDKMLTNRAK